MNFAGYTIRAGSLCRVTNSVYILGLSAMGHDPAAALIDSQGAIVAAIEEGKLGRTRSFGGIPRGVIHFCLERAKIRWQDIERVAVASEPIRAFFRKALFRARLAPLAPISSAYYFNKALGELGRELNNSRILHEMVGRSAGRVVHFDHHLSHAASAYFGSPFEKALIVSLDNQGDGRAGLVGLGEGTRISELSSIPFPNSMAWLFTQVTDLLGFSKSASEHKTQWLSLSGEPVYSELFVNMLRRGPKGPPHLNQRFFKRDFARRLSFSGEFYRQLGIPSETLAEFSTESPGNPLRMNIASSFERACEIVLADWLESLRSRTGAKKLCLAGGLFLNPLLVAAIEKETGFEEIFVQPA